MLEVDVNVYEIITAQKNKLEIGREYAVTFDPSFVFNSHVGYKRVFKLTKGENPVQSNNSDLFINPTDDAQDVVGWLTFHQVYISKCSIVYCRLMPADDLFEGNLDGYGDLDTMVENRIFSDTVHDHAHGQCLKYIITDNVMNIKKAKLYNVS